MAGAVSAWTVSDGDHTGIAFSVGGSAGQASGTGAAGVEEPAPDQARIVVWVGGAGGQAAALADGAAGTPASGQAADGGAGGAARAGGGGGARTGAGTGVAPVRGVPS